MSFFLERLFIFFFVFIELLGIDSSILLAQEVSRQISSDKNRPLSQSLNYQQSDNKSFGSEGRKDSSVILPLPGRPEGSIFREPNYSSLDYQVHIVGEVAGNSGTFRVPASTRLYEALQLAGGVNKQGSERRIELRRRESGRQRIDLFRFRRSGNLDDNPYLLDNDVIFVPLRDKVVEIEGTVKRPGIYELIDEKSLEDLIKLAGGFTPGVIESVPIKIVRVSSGEKQLLDVGNTKTERIGFDLQKGDVVVVSHLLTANKNFDYSVSHYPGDNGLFFPTTEERIFVLGAVNTPGPLPFNPNYGVRQYLTLAGGMTKLAKNRKIYIVNSLGKIIEIRQKLEMNPGDTIVVPERYLAPESFLSLVLGITTSVLGITTAVITLAR